MSAEQQSLRTFLRRKRSRVNDPWIYPGDVRHSGVTRETITKGARRA